MTWITDGQFQITRAGHLMLRVWDNVRSYWEVSVGAHVLGTGVSRDIEMAKFDARASAQSLAKTVEQELL